MNTLNISTSLTRKVWRQLSRSQVPIVNPAHMSGIFSWCKEINSQIRTHSYVPGIGHGYLGVEKNRGVTRFIPILSKEDIAVYYQICGELGDAVIRDVSGIYGGWRAIPTPRNTARLAQTRRSENNLAGYQQNYFTSTFSNAAWFSQFRSFNDVIASLVKSRNFGRYVIKTDIANFYDSIDIRRLTTKLMYDAPEYPTHISILEMFLNFWNRRTVGYQPSTRGIPQEIISDGSRNLSHYYLQDFDERFMEYCSAENLRYIRWADDILIYGQSHSALESSVYNASKLLLADGLNLSAPKTQIFTVRDFARFRGLNVLQSIEQKDQTGFQKAIREMRKLPKGTPVRLDTIFRATIGYTADLRSRASSFERSFLLDTVVDHPEFVGGLNTKQLFRLVATSDIPNQMFQRIKKLALMSQITAPKANLLMLIREVGPDLERTGIPKRTISKCVKDISESTDSEIIHSFCVPPAVEKGY